MGVLDTDAKKLHASDLISTYDAGLVDRKTFLTQLMETTGKQPQKIEDLLASEIVKNAKLLDYIRQLRKQGYKIGLLSNIASNWIREILLDKKEQALFDEMIMSFEVGMVKPEARIFELACNRLGVALKEAVLIDDVERYCMAAREVGMQAVVYRDFDQAKQE